MNDRVSINVIADGLERRCAMARALGCRPDTIAYYSEAAWSVGMLALRTSRSRRRREAEGGAS